MTQSAGELRQFFSALIGFRQSVRRIGRSTASAAAAIGVFHNQAGRSPRCMQIMSPTTFQLIQITIPESNRSIQVTAFRNNLCESIREKQRHANQGLDLERSSGAQFCGLSKANRRRFHDTTRRERSYANEDSDLGPTFATGSETGPGHHPDSLLARTACKSGGHGLHFLFTSARLEMLHKERGYHRTSSKVSP